MVEKKKVGRPKKQDALTPAQKQAAYRERKKALENVRLTTEVEIPTALILTEAATLMKSTVSKVVADLVEAFLNEDTLTDMFGAGADLPACDVGDVDEGIHLPRIAYVTRDANPRQVDLDLPAKVHAFVKGCKGMSAGAVIETLVNARCFPVPEKFIGGEDAFGFTLSEWDWKARRLLYNHPENDDVFLTSMYALTPEDDIYAVAATKYKRRHDINCEFARAYKVTMQNIADRDDLYINALVESMNKTASFISESVNERIRSRIRQQERRTNYADPVEGEVYENENGYVPRRRSNDRKSNTGEGIYEDAR